MKESLLAKIARERREAKAAAASSSSPETRSPHFKMPMKKLVRGKSIKSRVRTVEVPAKPLLIRVCDLVFHPKLARIGLLPKLIERESSLGFKAGKSRDDHKGAAAELGLEFDALKLSILENGILDPIKVVRDPKHPGNWLVADGRHRFLAAQHIIADPHILDPRHLAHADKLEKEGIPCTEIQPGEVDAVILAAVNRRHFSKGALAYLSVLMHPEIATEAKRGRPVNSAEIAELTAGARAADLAMKAGVSLRTLESAIRLYKHFAAREDARLIFEPGIWIGESLDRILGGVANFLLSGATADQETEEQRKARLAMERAGSTIDRLDRLCLSWKDWEKMLPEGRAAVTERAVLVLSEAPQALREAINEALS